MAHKLTKSKARKILKEGTARGKKLTAKQKKFFGAVAGGQKPYKDTLKHPKARTKVNRAIKGAKKAVPAGMHKMAGGQMMSDAEMKKMMKKTMKVKS